MKKLFFLFIVFGCITANSQTKQVVLKTVTFTEVEKLQKENPKPIVVFVYTDWCKFCFSMKQRSFKNKEIVQYLNDHFYFINLNAESKKNITFLTSTFNYKPTGTNTGIHELANELASVKGRVSYPTTTILNTNFEIDIQKVGYLDQKTIKKLLTNYIKYNETL